jgi:hypothetical protein
MTIKTMLVASCTISGELAVVKVDFGGVNHITYGYSLYSGRVLDFDATGTIFTLTGYSYTST